MDPKITKKTQDTLGKIIKKPPLTDKLLGKPPFRFLHDVVTSVIKTTGFMKGLYTEAEMNSENVKEKEAKIAFLQKAIDMVSAVVGRGVSAKPAKVVAGHEPERTNEFLQALASAISAGVDSDEYVKKVLSGGGGESKKDRGDKEEKREKDKERTRSASRRKDDDKHRKEEKSHDREKDREKRHRSRDGDGQEEKEKERHRDRREKSRDREDRHRDKDKDRERRRRRLGADSRVKQRNNSADIHAKQPSSSVNNIGLAAERQTPVRPTTGRKPSDSSIVEEEKDSSSNAPGTTRDKTSQQSLMETPAEKARRKPEREVPKSGGKPVTHTKVTLNQKKELGGKKQTVKKSPTSAQGLTPSPQKTQPVMSAKGKQSNSGRTKSPDKRRRLLASGNTSKTETRSENSTVQKTSASSTKSPRSGKKESPSGLSKSPSFPPSPDRPDPNHRKHRDVRRLDKFSPPLTKHSSSPVLHSVKSKAPTSVNSKVPVKKSLKTVTTSRASVKKQASEASSDSHESPSGKRTEVRRSAGSGTKTETASSSGVSAGKLGQESSHSQNYHHAKKGASAETTPKHSVRTGEPGIATSQCISTGDSDIGTVGELGLPIPIRKAGIETNLFVPTGFSDSGTNLPFHIEEKHKGVGREQMNTAGVPKVALQKIIPANQLALTAGKDDVMRVTSNCLPFSSLSNHSQTSPSTDSSSESESDEQENQLPQLHASGFRKLQPRKQVINMSKKIKAKTAGNTRLTDTQDFTKKPAGLAPKRVPISEDSKERKSILKGGAALSPAAGDKTGTSEAKGKCVAAKASLSRFNLPADDSAPMKEVEEKENESPEQNGEKESSQDAPSRLQRPTSAKGSRRRRQGREARDDDDEEFQQRENHEPTIGENDLPPQVTAARKMARPPSARPAPPRPKQDGVDAEPAMRLGTGAPTNLIVDDGKQSDDEDENFLVEEAAPPPPPQEPVSAQAEAEDDAEHGALVKKMLESKKEAEQQQQPTKKTEIERPTMSDAQRRKQRELVAKEIERLQTSIQSLTRSANPLGKIMDYVQEDMDSMQKELDRWRSENKEHALALRRERNVTDRAIEPLKAQLDDIDRAISDQLDLIAATKSNIIRNDNRTQKMLQSIARS